MSPSSAPRAPLLLLAASGLAREAASAARAAGDEVLGCLDDDVELVGTEVGPGLPVLGPITDVTAHPGARLVVCAGRGASRAAIVERLARVGVDAERYATIVDPGVRIGAGSSVGAGSILLAGTVLTADVAVGEHVVCIPQVVLTHDCRVEAYATVCAG
ncbi:MAG: acetyltransferase, partial [Lapillicoccus sp.]